MRKNSVGTRVVSVSVEHDDGERECVRRVLVRKYLRVVADVHLFLKISDPPLAATVKRAAGNYVEISLAAKQLASMRKLSRMGLKGKVMEYDPVGQDMLGGHQLGVVLHMPS